MILVLFPIPSLRSTRLGRSTFIFISLIAIIFATLGSLHAADEDYVYPKELHYGALNALRGTNFDDAQVAIEMNFDRLSKMKNPNFRVKLDYLSDTPAAAKLIEQQRLHALSVTGIEFLLLRSLVAVTPLVVASKLNESPLEPYVLLSSKGISLDQLATMGQRRLIVESNNRQDIGRIWLETALYDKGFADSANFFTSIQVTSKSVRMILPVFFGQAEACLVPKSAYDTMVELNPQVGQKLGTLLRSPGFPKNLICTADFLDPELVEEMEKSLLNMHTTEVGRQLMMIFQLRRNFPFKSDYLIETERVFNKYQKIKNFKEQ